MKNRLALLAILFFALLPTEVPANEPAELAERCLHAIDRVRSYDVTMEVTTLVYPAASNLNAENEPLKAATRLIRDVLAQEHGRRVEVSVDDEEAHSIAVKSWNVATTGPNGMAHGLSYAIDSDYFKYYNQNCSGFLVSELLKKPETTIRMVEHSTNKDELGIELAHRKLHGPVRIWMDANHGYIPTTIEKYTLVNGKQFLHTRSHVTRFHQVSDSVWVPVEGISEQFFNGPGPLAGRTVLGDSMKVLVERSSWNAIESGELFSTSNMPPVNAEQMDWKVHNPPAIEKAVKAAEAAKAAAIKAHPTTVPIVRNRSALIILLMNVSLATLIVGYFVWKRSRRSRCQT